jgi:hypothetical protein
VNVRRCLVGRQLPVSGTANGTTFVGQAHDALQGLTLYDGQLQVMLEASKGGRKTRTHFVSCPAVVIVVRQAYSATQESPNFASGCSQDASVTLSWTLRLSQAVPARPGGVTVYKPVGRACLSFARDSAKEAGSLAARSIELGDIGASGT